MCYINRCCCCFGKKKESRCQEVPERRPKSRYARQQDWLISEGQQTKLDTRDSPQKARVKMRLRAGEGWGVQHARMLQLIEAMVALKHTDKSEDIMHLGWLESTKAVSTKERCATRAWGNWTPGNGEAELPFSKPTVFKISGHKSRSLWGCVSIKDDNWSGQREKQRFNVTK